MPRAADGFTLVELAIALVVVTLLAGGVLLATRVQLTQRQSGETRQALEEAREALLAFAAANGRLPCPASSGVPGQGIENCSITPTSPTQRGLLPWESLGIRGVDGWNRRLAYITSRSFTTAGFGLSTAGAVTISAGTAAGGTSLATNGAVAAAVWSFGGNGRFATLMDGTGLPGSGAGSDEQSNNSASTGNTVVSRDESENTSDPGGTFDDQVIWISRYVLFGRMMSAGQLP
jgi:prepilin-type N-terminal cleavage/methylation domain-containing protein